MKRSFKNFKIAAGLVDGEFFGTWWHDGDFYKWMEAKSVAYAQTGEEELARHLDEIIDVIAQAQEPDGYISTPIQIGHGTYKGSFDQERPLPERDRWESGRPHEVYNMGHLLTSAVVHHRATGKTNFLEVAVRVGDHLYDVFSEPSERLSKLNYNPSHLMGLVELYRTTGEKKYLELAGTILDMRGMGNQMHNQNHVPVRRAQEVVGHAVLGNYLYCGGADIVAESGEDQLHQALDRLWHDAVEEKMYVTGGVAALHHGAMGYGDHTLVHEAYGREYQLPNSTAYNETCSSIAQAMWSWRMHGLRGDVQYADVMERVLYNAVLASIGLEGKTFFYTNVLRWYGEDHKLMSGDSRGRWGAGRGGICCPPNILRMLVEIGNYACSLGEDALNVNLYGANRIESELPGGTGVAWQQETDYPWDGDITLTCIADDAATYTLRLRIPDWATAGQIQVNGKMVNENVEPGRYLSLERTWEPGDTVEITLPMEVQLIEAHHKVEATRGQIAVQRGPVVYALESVDLPDGVEVEDVVIPDDVEFQPVRDPEILKGAVRLKGTVLVDEAPDDALYQRYEADMRPVDLQLVPYYAWNNRGQGGMSVWLPVDQRA